jgi:hypothetical protein
MRKLLREKVFSPGPEGHPGAISPGKTAVSVKLNLVEHIPGPEAGFELALHASAR